MYVKGSIHLYTFIIFSKIKAKVEQTRVLYRNYCRNQNKYVGIKVKTNHGCNEEATNLNSVKEK